MSPISFTPSSSYCKMHSQNVNGLRSRLPEFNADVLANDANIYMLCETNLDESIHSTEVFPPNFVVYRCDRSNETEKLQSTKKVHGGGVLIAIHESFKSQIVGTGTSYGAEMVCAKINSKNRSIYLIEIYIRPHSTIEVYEAHMKALRDITEMMSSEDILILSGDFNLPKLSWFTDEMDDPEIAIPINASGKRELTILDTCHELGLLQINKICNDNSTMLDLIWTNCVEMISCHSSEYHLLKHETHHPAFEIRIHENFQNKQNEAEYETKYRNFLGADYDVINNELINIEWEDALIGNDFDRDINKFYDIINSVITQNVELKTRKVSKHPKWFNCDLINLKNRVSKLQKLKKTQKSPETIKNHTELRKEYKNNARLAYKNYKIEMEHLINDDPQKFFEFVNSSNKTVNDIPNEMMLGDKISGKK